MIRAQHWIMVLIFLPIVLFVTTIWLGTKYTLIDNQHLKIQCGLIHFATIDVLKITKIEKTNTLLSAPANSLDRIELFYNKYDSVVISPPNKVLFVQMLLEINPGIKTEIT